MKRKTIILVIILMGISLSGIILVQLFWISNAFQVREALFDRGVIDALSEVVGKTDTKMKAEQLTKRMFLTDADSNEFIRVTGDSIFYYHGHNGNIDLLGDSAATSVVVSTITASPHSGENDTRMVVSVKNEGNKKNAYAYALEGEDIYWESDDDQLILKIPDDSIRFLVKNRLKKMDKKAVQMETVIEQMEIEIDTYSKPFEEMVDINKLKKNINKALIARNIPLEWEYAITSTTSDKIFKKASVGYEPGLEDDNYSAELFPGKIFERTDILSIQFPEKDRLILKSLLILLAGSLILTLIILLTFAYTLYIILRQKKVSEIKSDFINNMTHEFKTPIATISLAVDAIENPKVTDDSKQVKYYSGMIREENRRMNAHVEQVLRMSMLDKKELEPELETYDLHDLMKKAINNVSLLVEQKNGEIEAHFDANNTMFQVDELHFMNVIINILDNAIKYSIEKPEIIMKTANNEEGIEINISDKGIGMSKEVQKKIFEKFYRQEGGNLHNVKGFGLGLSYARAIIELFKGTISVSSEPGQGSTFTIFLPYPDMS